MSFDDFKENKDEFEPEAGFCSETNPDLIWSLVPAPKSKTGTPAVRIRDGDESFLVQGKHTCTLAVHAHQPGVFNSS